MAVERLSRVLIYKVVNNYIGVKDGYLGDFNYRTHREFYPLYCDIDIEPTDYGGTTRDRFTTILTNSDPRIQARILRGVLDRFPLDQPNCPESRTPVLRDEIQSVIWELERNGPVDALIPTYNVDVVN